MTWFPYKPTAGGHMPVVSVQLALGEETSFPISFVVDSGADISIVPRLRVAYMLQELAHLPEVDTGRRDANGRPLRGVQIDFDVMVRNSDLPRTKEGLWVISGGDWGLLGQTWFERHAVHFHNFAAAAKGRRFAMHPVKL
jgi:hypothetical protein